MGKGASPPNTVWHVGICHEHLDRDYDHQGRLPCIELGFGRPDCATHRASHAPLFLFIRREDGPAHD